MDEAKDASEAACDGTRVRLAIDSPPEEEGGTARMVDFERVAGCSSSSTPKFFSKSDASSGGDEGRVVVLPWENLSREKRTVEGADEGATRVSSSE